MKHAIFYHAGCQVCVEAESSILALIPQDKIEVVHLGDQPEQVNVARSKGVKSVPAIVTQEGEVLHINFGAAIEAL